MKLSLILMNAVICMYAAVVVASGKNYTRKLEEDVNEYVTDLDEWIEDVIDSEQRLPLETHFIVKNEALAEKEKPCGSLALSKVFKQIRKIADKPWDAQFNIFRAYEILWKPEASCILRHPQLDEIEGGVGVGLKVSCGDEVLMEAGGGGGGEYKSDFQYTGGSNIAVNILNGSIEIVGGVKNGWQIGFQKFNVPLNSSAIVDQFENRVRECASNQTLFIESRAGGGWSEKYTENGTFHNDVVGYGLIVQMGYPPEQPATAIPTTEVPSSTEVPETESPATEAPATETTATEAPATETTATEATATEATATEAPATEAPATEATATETTATEAPATEATATEATATEAPATEATATEATATEATATEATATEATATEATATEATATEAPATEATATETTATEATATEATATEAPATEAPATEATATEAPATETTATETTATEAPIVTVYNTPENVENSNATVQEVQMTRSTSPSDSLREPALSYALSYYQAGLDCETSEEVACMAKLGSQKLLSENSFMPSQPEYVLTEVPSQEGKDVEGSSFSWMLLAFLSTGAVASIGYAAAKRHRRRGYTSLSPSMV